MPILERKTFATDHVFSYEHAGLKNILYFNTDLLERIRLQRPEWFQLTTLDIPPEIYNMILTQFGVEEAHLARIDDERLAKPGLGVHFEDAGFVLVDGSHRLVKRYRLGMRTMDVWTTVRPVWELCLIDPNPEQRTMMDSARGPIVPYGFDHPYEAGAFGVCSRCGKERH